MKKLASLIILLFVSQLISAQGQITKELGDFDEIKIFDLIEAQLIQSDEQKVIINGKHADKVKIVNTNGKLKIRMEIDKRFKGESVSIQVYYKSLDIIDANEGAQVTMNNQVEQYEIEVKTQEGARIEGDFNVDRIVVKAVTGGIVAVTGKAKSQEVTVNTGGVYEGKTLETERAKVTVQAGGDVEVHASKKIDIKIRAGGDVYVYGNPEDVSKSNVFGGRVKFF